MKKLHGKYSDAKTGKASLLLVFLLAAILSLSGCSKTQEDSGAGSEAVETQEAEQAPEKPQDPEELPTEEQREEILAIDEIAASFEPDASIEIPDYSGDVYVVMNDNIPFFTKENLPTTSFAYYSELDELGRCGTACANVGRDLMPEEERGDISQIKPSGWQSVKYEQVDGDYLYNRCHLIGYQLSGENANEKNLITGTRYLNVQGMLPFENLIADYVNETGNHVLYRAAPVFDGEDLVAYGVLLEGWSVEDEGDGVCFNVFVYNVQPDIVIDYADGDSHLDESALAAAEEETAKAGNTGTDAQNGPEPESLSPQPADDPEPVPAGTDYILNTNTGKFHYPDCRSVRQMAEKNKQVYNGSRDEVIGMGYVPCKNCNP